MAPPVAMSVAATLPADILLLVADQAMPHPSITDTRYIHEGADGVAIQSRTLGSLKSVCRHWRNALAARPSTALCISTVSEAVRVVRRAHDGLIDLTAFRMVYVGHVYHFKADALVGENTPPGRRLHLSHLELRGDVQEVLRNVTHASLGRLVLRQSAAARLFASLSASSLRHLVITEFCDCNGRYWPSLPDGLLGQLAILQIPCVHPGELPGTRGWPAEYDRVDGLLVVPVIAGLWDYGALPDIDLSRHFVQLVHPRVRVEDADSAIKAIEAARATWTPGAWDTDEWAPDPWDFEPPEVEQLHHLRTIADGSRRNGGPRATFAGDAAYLGQDVTYQDMHGRVHSWSGIEGVPLVDDEESAHPYAGVARILRWARDNPCVLATE